MVMVRTAPITPLTQNNAYHEVHKLNTSLSFFKKGLCPWPQLLVNKLTQRAWTLHTHKIGIAGQHRLCNFFRRFI